MGRLFRSIPKGARVGERLDPSQAPRILKAMAADAGLPEDVVRNLPGHSTRVGVAQDMIAAGIELLAIMQAGRWKSAAMVNRYGEHLLAERGASVRLARLQRRARPPPATFLRDLEGQRGFVCPEVEKREVERVSRSSMVSWSVAMPE